MRPRPFLLLLAGVVLALFCAIPDASAGAMLMVDGGGDDDMTSFGPAGGGAYFLVYAMNFGDEDYTGVTISASFDDASWTADQVYFESWIDGDHGNGTADLGSMEAEGYDYVIATVSIPESAENGDSVTFTATFDADGDLAAVDFTVVVTDWVAFSGDEAQSYEVGDTEEDCAASASCNIYTITVINLNEADISNEITIGFAGADEGWLVAGDDWDEMSRTATLFGMAGGDEYNVSLEISLVGVNVPAGDATLAFQAHDEDGYIQPFFIVMNATVADFFDVKVSGSGSQSVAASGGDVSWNVTIRNMGNTGDNFDFSFDTSDADAGGWSTTGTDGGNTGYLDWKGSGDESEHSFTVSMSVPAGLSAGTSHGFTMSVVSPSSGAAAATQSFSATVDQSYGLSLTCSACQATKAPGETAEFSFTITNDGNGEDSYAVVVGGPSAYGPASDAAEVTVAAGATGQFVVSATVPADKQAHTQSGDITVTVTSEDGETNVIETVTVSVRQIHDLAFSYALNATGVEVNSVEVAQSTNIQLQVILSNNGNGYDTASLELVDAPAWATLEHTSVPVTSGGQVTISVNLAPDVTSLSGRTYTFQVQATASDGVETATSGDLSVKIAEQETEGEEIDTEEKEPIASIDSVSPSPTEIGKTVFFNGTGSDSDGTVVAYLWQSSIDGELSTEASFDSSNLSRGTHTITFQVTDNDGLIATDSRVLFITKAGDSEDNGGDIPNIIILLVVFASGAMAFELYRRRIREKEYGNYVDDRDPIIKDSVVSKSSIGAGGKSKGEQIKVIKELLDSGAIDDAEFKQMKKEILGK